MSIAVDFIYASDFRLTKEQETILVELIILACQRESRTHGEVVLTLCDNKYIQELNRQYRNIDKPTDVLSFPMEDEEIIGDIVISIPKAEAQALEYGHTFIRELGFLTVHGCLHLLGYDHQTPEDEKVMVTIQEDILQVFGLTR